MPKLRCECGNRISRGGIPNPYGFCMIKESDVETVVDGIMNDHLEAYSIFHDKSIEVLECEECKRIYISWNEIDFISYKRED